MRYTDSFVPPRKNAMVNGIGKGILLPIVQCLEGLDVRAVGSTVSTLKQLRNQPTVIMPNHSDRLDPMAVFALSKFCKEDFYYAAARETFDENYCFRGWLFQNLGAYSVNRGAHDLQYLNTTIALIKESKQKLVIFPEGEVTGHLRRMEPIKKDGIRCLFIAQQQLLNDYRRACVHIVPLAIYYQTLEDARTPLMNAISRIENELGLPTKHIQLEARIEAVSHILLANLESYYGLSYQDKGSFMIRVRHLSNHFSAVVSHLFGINVEWSKPETTIQHAIAAQLRRPEWAEHLTDSPYNRRLLKRVQQRSQSFAADSDRISRLMVIGSLLEEPFELEKIRRIVDCLEYEIFGKPSWKGRRTAILEASDPIELQTLCAEYERNKEETLKHVASLVHDAIQHRLTKLKEGLNTDAFLSEVVK